MYARRWTFRGHLEGCLPPCPWGKGLYRKRQCSEGQWGAMWQLAEFWLCPTFSRSPGECWGPTGIVNRDGRKNCPTCSLSAAWGRHTPETAGLPRDYRTGMVGQPGNVGLYVCMRVCVHLCVCETGNRPWWQLCHMHLMETVGWSGLRMSSGGGGWECAAARRTQTPRKRL